MMLNQNNRWKVSQDRCQASPPLASFLMFVRPTRGRMQWSKSTLGILEVCPSTLSNLPRRLTWMLSRA